jgi:hypothetical protein
VPNPKYIDDKIKPMKKVLINNNQFLTELLTKTTQSLSSQKQDLPDLSLDECLQLGEFNNIMDLVNILLTRGSKQSGVTQASLLFLLHQGLFEYQNKADDEGNLARDFTLCQCIEAQIKTALNDADDELFSLIREIIASLFDVGMAVSDEFLEIVNDIEYDFDNSDHPEVELKELVGHMETLAKEIKAKSCFDVYLQIAEQLNQMPSDAGLLIITGLLHAKDKLVRDSAILFLLHPQAKVRESLLEGLVALAQQQLLNDVDFQRLLTLRRWVDDQAKVIVDSAIKQMQRNQINLHTSQPLAAIPVHAIWITPIDNSGSMILQVVFKDKRRFRLIGCILKQKHGIKDAYASDAMTQKDYDKILAKSSDAMPTINITQEQLIALLCHFIAENQASHRQVPVEILMLKEYLANDAILPQKLTLASVKQINQSITRNQTPELSLEDFLYGWGSPTLAGNHKNVKAVIQAEFEPNRQLWFERLLLSSLCFEFTLEQCEVFLDALKKMQAGKPLTKIDFFRDLGEIILDEDQPIAGTDIPSQISEAMLQQMLTDDPSLLEKLAQINLSGEFDFDEDYDLAGLPALKWPISDRPKRAVYQLKITLHGCKPAVWRRVLVMNTASLEKLHVIVQIAMGWSNDHLYEFECNKHRFGLPDELSYGEIYDDRSVQVRDLLINEKSKLNYTYDFGDNWQHQIVLEKILPAARKNTPVQIKAGTGACPPEDCGGVPGYNRLQQILKKPKHEEYDEILEWLGLESGKNFDPSYFDQDETNQLLNEIFN